MKQIIEKYFKKHDCIYLKSSESLEISMLKSLDQYLKNIGSIEDKIEQLTNSLKNKEKFISGPEASDISKELQVMKRILEISKFFSVDIPKMYEEECNLVISIDKKTPKERDIIRSKVKSLEEYRERVTTDFLCDLVKLRKYLNFHNLPSDSELKAAREKAISLSKDERQVLVNGKIDGNSDDFQIKKRTVLAGFRLLSEGLFVATGDGCTKKTDWAKLVASEVQKLDA